MLLMCVLYKYTYYFINIYYKHRPFVTFDWRLKCLPKEKCGFESGIRHPINLFHHITNFRLEMFSPLTGIQCDQCWPKAAHGHYVEGSSKPAHITEINSHNKDKHMLACVEHIFSFIMRQRHDLFHFMNSLEIASK